MSQASANIDVNGPNGNAPAGETAMRQALRKAIADTTERTAPKTSKAATKARAGKAAPTNTASDQRAPITLADAIALCAHQGLADNLARIFGLEPVDMESVRNDTDASIRQGAATLASTLNEKAMAIHLQRIVGAYVGSAHGAGRFYSEKVTQARDLTAKIADDAGEADRDGVAGFDSKAERARAFAAEMGIQSATLLAAAEGAANAYEHLTGEAWKPYDTRRQDNTKTVTRRAASEEMSAFAR